MLLLCPLFFALSCISPDRGDCPPRQNVRIVVRTITEVTRTAGGSNEIDNVTIYVFDQQERFVTAWQGDAYTYGQVYQAYLDIDPGTYRFVVWTNHGATYSASHTLAECGAETPYFQDLTLSMACPSGNRLESDIQSLHHGSLPGATVYAGMVNEFTIVLRPNTYKINYTVKGLPADGCDYSFSVRDNNSRYTFANATLQGSDHVEHLRTVCHTGGHLTASMKVLSLCDTRTPAFDFSNATTGQSLLSDDLVSMIKRAYASSGRSVDFNSTFEFDIVLTYEANVGVHVSVNGWGYSGNPTEL